MRIPEQRSAGFTLLELLLAIVILGLVLATVYGALSRTEDSKRHAEERAELFSSGRQAVLRMASDIEASLPPTDLTRFQRILQQRSGRAVVPFENGLCSGCRTRIRLPMVTEIRVKGVILCESCQRILYDPVKR